MSLDVETEDLRRPGLCLIGTLSDLDTACLAPASRLDLCLDDHHGRIDGCGGFLRPGRGSGPDAAGYRNPVGLEDVSRLVLVQIHTCLRAPLRWDNPTHGGNPARVRRQTDAPKPIRDRRAECEVPRAPC